MNITNILVQHSSELLNKLVYIYVGKENSNYYYNILINNNITNFNNEKYDNIEKNDLVRLTYSKKQEFLRFNKKFLSKLNNKTQLYFIPTFKIKTHKYNFNNFILYNHEQFIVLNIEYFLRYEKINKLISNINEQ